MSDKIIEKKEYDKVYRVKNKEEIKEKQRAYYLKNRERIYAYFKKYKAERKEHYANLNKKWFLNNKKRRQEYVNKRERHQRKTNPTFKIKAYMRVRIYAALKGINKAKKTMDLLGCTIEQLWIHLEKTFKPGMTRENYGKWHVDHIIPCASFDLTIPEQQTKCFHYTNLQALWASENIIKSDKIL
jgi:hypothetical protein